MNFDLEIENIMLITKLTDDLDNVLNNLAPSLLNYEKHMKAYNLFVSKLPYNLTYDMTSGLIETTQPSTMSNEVFNESMHRLQIYAHAVDFRCEEINSQIKLGFSLEKELKVHNPNFKSEILSRAREFANIQNNNIVPGHKPTTWKN
jgi:hypothetical protein